ncbi:MAG: PAS domain S-box protein [Nitrospinota bacterium]|nr:PAS domain S-box protein [Nitrospinota bacterium]
MVMSSNPEESLAGHAAEPGGLKEKWRALVQNSHDTIVLADKQERILFINHPISGVQPSELAGGNFIIDCLCPGEEDSFREVFHGVFQTGEPTSFGPVSCGKEQGARAWYTGKIAPIKSEGGVSAALIMLRDITSSKLAEDDMERFFTLAPQIFCIASPQGYFTKVNPAFVRTLGYSKQELLSRPFWEFIHPDDRTPTMMEVERQLGGGTTLNFINRYMTADGEVRWFSWKAIQDVHTGLLYAAADDVTEKKDLESANAALISQMAARKKVESLALASEARYRALLDAIMDGFWLVDDQGIIQEVNQTYLNMTGYSRDEMVGRSISLFDAAYSHEEMARKIVTVKLEGSARFETRHRRKDGKIIDVEISANHKILEEGFFVTLIRDITERRTLQQTQKLEAVGQLAGGMAHEFNNVLQGILGFASLLEAHEGLDVHEKEYVDHILKGTRRGAELVRRILAFSRKADHEKKPLSVAHLFHDVTKMLTRTLPATVDIRHGCPGDIGMVLADQTQLIQVLTNLLINGSHAISGPGTLTLSAVNCLPGGVDPHGDGEAGCATCPHRQRSEDRVCIAVADTGHGISQMHHERIFEPFFTTKEAGLGTGLGLAVVHGIVRENGGHIHFRSELGVGTTFYLSLPKIAPVKLLEAEEEPAEAMGAGERILFVDDEEMITTMAKIYLERAGYKVDVFNNHTMAMEAFASGPGRYSLVVTDQTMRGTTGVELAQKMKQLRPGMPIILITGYNRKLTIERALRAGINRVLSKPMAPRELSLAIRQALDGQG